MPPTRASLKALGWSDERINAAYEKDLEDERKIEEYLKTHPNATMLDILDLL